MDVSLFLMGARGETYEDVLQPQLSGSRLAPVVLGIGQRVPGVGKFGPRDLPRKTPKATPIPSPTPKK